MLADSHYEHAVCQRNQFPRDQLAWYNAPRKIVHARQYRGPKWPSGPQWPRLKISGSRPVRGIYSIRGGFTPLDGANNGIRLAEPHSFYIRDSAASRCVNRARIRDLADWLAFQFTCLL